MKRIWSKAHGLYRPFSSLPFNVYSDLSVPILKLDTVDKVITFSIKSDYVSILINKSKLVPYKNNLVVH